MLTVQCCSLSRAMLNTRSPGLILRWLLSFTGVELFAPECWPHYGYGPWHYPFWSLDMFGVLCIWNGCYFSPSLGSHSATDQQLFLKSINFGYCPNLKPIVLVVYHLATLQQGRPMEFTAGAPVSNNHRCCLMTFVCFRVCTIWDRWGCALRHRLSPAGAGWFLIAKLSRKQRYPNIYSTCLEQRHGYFCRVALKSRRWDDQSWAGSAPFSFVANRVHSGGNAFHCDLSASPWGFFKHANSRFHALFPSRVEMLWR